jgi:hypothetical protein
MPCCLSASSFTNRKATRGEGEAGVYPVTNRSMEAFYAEFPLEALPSDPHQHGGAEFIYVLRGALWVKVGEEEGMLNAGDAIYFDSRVPQLPPRWHRRLHGPGGDNTRSTRKQCQLAAADLLKAMVTFVPSLGLERTSN